ncbi:hypothetical protein H310_03068 [Aphanomyces invadans]|uniref:DUF4371 domain-containing protein n=1 Tax=Aphanomyces invadans TaxID=157072 RepID=A0A024ULC5_9STRA|nr:hypothetical protein H310_03068 [Aphanomyces invadans]ETW06965.1 hypothetical protein H310_03068 [Aphanomyces invadans]|eukprot:XP_008865040.1 hypothetical protein H310_03068 [Aphanomyces invadans]
MIAKLGGINDTLVGRYVRVIVGHPLQALTTIVASVDVWVLALSFDGSTHRGTRFMDIRETMIVKLLYALFMGWIRKLIGVMMDGEKTNMGHRYGVQVRMVTYAQFKVVQVWCAPHQLDLQVHLYVDEIDGGAWVKKTYEVTVYLRR